MHDGLHPGHTQYSEMTASETRRYASLCASAVGDTPGNCFPASATVTVLIDGAPSTTAISQLHVGDMVMVRAPPQWLRCILPHPRFMAQPRTYIAWPCKQVQSLK